MSDLAKSIGRRIRSYRIRLDLSQEKLAELSGCHPTHIGQLERGEKNATLESIEKVAGALNIPLSTLFENLGAKNGSAAENIPQKCYEFLLEKSEEEQKQIFEMLTAMDKYKQI